MCTLGKETDGFDGLTQPDSIWTKSIKVTAYHLLQKVFEQSCNTKKLFSGLIQQVNEVLTY